MTLNEIYRTARANGQRDICRFMRDMKKAGLRMTAYNGRFYWRGPAVAVDDLQDAMSETKVPVQYDNLGLGWIVYPVSPLRGVERV